MRACTPTARRSKDSYVHMNDKPGFGIELDWKFIDRHRV